MAEYIDREEVYKRACRGCTRHGDEIGSCYEEEPCEELQSEFASAPAADVEPVIHAHWIVDDEYLVCSNCGESYLAGDTRAEVRDLLASGDVHKRCHGCGAHMDEGVKGDA